MAPRAGDISGEGVVLAVEEGEELLAVEVREGFCSLKRLLVSLFATTIDCLVEE